MLAVGAVPTALPSVIFTIAVAVPQMPRKLHKLTVMMYIAGVSSSCWERIMGATVVNSASSAYFNNKVLLRLLL